MSSRETWWQSVSCPKCGAKGRIERTEKENPVHNPNLDSRIEGIEGPFKARREMHSNETTWKTPILRYRSGDLERDMLGFRADSVSGGNALSRHRN